VSSLESAISYVAYHIKNQTNVNMWKKYSNSKNRNRV